MVEYKLGHNSPSYIQQRNGRLYFVRRVPDDIRSHYTSPKVRRSLRTNLMSVAARSAKSINQRPQTCWLGPKLQQIDIPAITLVRTPQSDVADECHTLSQAKDLCLPLKRAANNKTFVRSAHRNNGYVTRVPALDFTDIVYQDGLLLGYKQSIRHEGSRKCVSVARTVVFDSLVNNLSDVARDPFDSVGGHSILYQAVTELACVDS